MARDTLWTYPDFIETVKVLTDASAFQLGAVISQKGKPIDYYSRKLTYYQHWYTVTDRELLSIVENLKKLIPIWIIQKLRISTDHKNLTCNFLIPSEY